MAAGRAELSEVRTVRWYDVAGGSNIESRTKASREPIGKQVRRRPRLLSLSLYYVCLFVKGAYRPLGRNFLFLAATTCLGSTFGAVAFYGVTFFF